MQDFNDIQQLWKSNSEPAPELKFDFSKMTSSQQKMIRRERIGSILLSLTAIYILGLAYFIDFRHPSVTLYFAMFAVAAICFLQAFVSFVNAKKLKEIDENAAPSQYLQQWQSYNEFRKKLVRWNIPLYFVLLSAALGLYMVEVLQDGSLRFKIIAYALTFGWILFAYFYLGKRQLRKTENRINSIISELQNLESQFK